MARLEFLIAGATALLVLAGCRDPGQSVEAAPVQAPPPAPPSMLFRCDNGASTRVSYPDSNTALVNYQGRTVALIRGRSPSGARYAAEGLQWWAKDEVQAELTVLPAGQALSAAPGLRCIISSGATESLPAAAPGAPTSLAEDRTPVSEGRSSPQSPQGAVNVVQTYFALLEGARYPEAWALWAEDGAASGMDPAAFAESFAKYGAYHANIGAPGPVEARPGALYVEVPVQVYGRMRTGAPMTLLGSVGLTRPSDAPGVDPAQLQWRIAASDLRPTSAVAR